MFVRNPKLRFIALLPAFACGVYFQIALRMIQELGATDVIGRRPFIHVFTNWWPPILFLILAIFAGYVTLRVWKLSSSSWVLLSLIWLITSGFTFFVTFELRGNNSIHSIIYAGGFAIIGFQAAYYLRLDSLRSNQGLERP